MRTTYAGTHAGDTNTERPAIGIAQGAQRGTRRAKSRNAARKHDRDGLCRAAIAERSGTIMVRNNHASFFGTMHGGYSAFGYDGDGDSYLAFGVDVQEVANAGTPTADQRAIFAKLTGQATRENGSMLEADRQAAPIDYDQSLGASSATMVAASHMGFTSEANFAAGENYVRFLGLPILTVTNEQLAEAGILNLPAGTDPGAYMRILVNRFAMPRMLAIGGIVVGGVAAAVVLRNMIAGRR